MMLATVLKALLRRAAATPKAGFHDPAERAAWVRAREMTKARAALLRRFP